MKKRCCCTRRMVSQVALPGEEDGGLCLPKKSATDPFPPAFCVYTNYTKQALTTAIFEKCLLQ